MTKGKEIIKLMKLAHRIGLSVNFDELGFSDINEK